MLCAGLMCSPVMVSHDWQCGCNLCGSLCVHGDHMILSTGCDWQTGLGRQ